MIDEIKTLASPYFLEGTYQIDISEWIPFEGKIRLDTEKIPPLIYRELESLEISTASNEELGTILDGLRSLPLLRRIMYKYEIHALFTENERAIIRSLSPSFVELLMMADDPVDTEKVIPFLTHLYENKIISFERFFKLTGIR